MAPFFHPTYKLIDQPITPLATLERARKIGLAAGLLHVYEGNVPGQGENTICPNCKQTIIKRVGFTVQENNVIDGKCKQCQSKIAGVWE